MSSIPKRSLKDRMSDFDLPKAQYGKTNPVTEKLKNTSYSYSTGVYPSSSYHGSNPSSPETGRSVTGIYYCQNTPLHR